MASVSRLPTEKGAEPYTTRGLRKKGSSMFTKKSSVMIALAIAAIALCSVAAKRPVQRPFYGEATAVWTIAPDGTATCVQEGVATHSGRFKATGEAVWDLAHFLILSGSGVSVSANGDKIFWEIGPNNSVIFTGGTGRFEDATGRAETTLKTAPIVDVHSDGTVTVTFSYTAAGKCKY